MKFLKPNYIQLILISILIISYKTSSLAQTIPKTKPVDTTYIGNNPYKWSVRLYSQTKYNRFNISGGSSKRIFYTPTSKLSIGLGASYYNFFLDLGANVNYTRKSDTVSQTKNFDLLGSVYAVQHILDYTFQLYQGFFSDTTKTLSGLDKDPKTFRQDLRIFNVGANYNYLFNYKRFSFTAPFTGIQIQKKSAGSPMAGFFFSYYDLRADSAILPANISSEFNIKANISEANILSAGLLGGYAYTLVLPLHFFITLSANPGISFNIGDAKSIKYYSIGHPATVSFKLLSRNAVGYTGTRWYGFFSWLADAYYVPIGYGNHLTYNTGKFKFLVGYRFIKDDHSPRKRFGLKGF